jgi:hypothetical protein
MNKNINKLDIETFFPNADNNISKYNGGRFDIDTLFKINKDNEKLSNFNKMDLLKSIQNKKEKIKKQYIVMYNSCCSKIQDANNYSVTDIIYDIPEFITDFPDYKPQDCIKFIKKQLLKQSFESYIISDTQIFISWFSIVNDYENN